MSVAFANSQPLERLAASPAKGLCSLGGATGALGSQLSGQRSMVLRIRNSLKGDDILERFCLF